TYTWQVAHEQLPPHSAIMPGRLLRTEPSITLWPAGTSTDDVVPSGSWYTTVGIELPPVRSVNICSGFRAEGRGPEKYGRAPMDQIVSPATGCAHHHI